MMNDFNKRHVDAAFSSNGRDLRIIHELLKQELKNLISARG